MKRFILSLLLSCAALAETTIPVVNPKLTTDGTSVNLNFSLAAPTSSSQGLIILLCADCPYFDAYSTLQNAGLWAQGSTQGKITAQAMIDSGAKLHSIIPLNAKQFYVVFTKN